MKSKVVKICLIILAVMYLMIMFILLFGKGIHARSVRMDEVAEQGYCTIVLSHCNFKPFVSIHSYIQNFTTMDFGDFSFKQIIGNTFMMFPLGVFLPCFWKKQKKFGVFVLTCFLSILCVEILQVLTLLGSFDVDDLILNLIGCSIGFLSYHLLNAILTRVTRNKQNPDLSQKHIS